MNTHSGKKLFLLTTLSQGGIETCLLRFLQWAKGRGEQYSVFCKGGRYGALENDYRAAGARLFVGRMGYLNVWEWWKFYRFLKREKFSAIYDFTDNFAGVPLLCAKLIGVKIRVASYQGAEDHFSPTMLRCLYGWLMKKLTVICSTRITSNSAAAFDYFYPGMWKNDSKFQVIYNGIDVAKLLASKGDKVKLREEFGIPGNAFVVGHTGRYNYAKNHDTIIEVALRLCKKYPDIYFFLAGLDVDIAYVGRVKQEGLEERIIMPGYRNDIPRLLYLMDVFYFPSVTEGQPNSLLEAEVVGLPIVASDISPMKEAVPESFVEKLVPPCDIGCAVNILEKLYLSEDMRKEYICQAWAMENFDAEIRFEELREVLRCN